MGERHSKQENERGAVLLTTLLLMTIMVAVAVSIVDNIRFSIQRAASVQQRAQLEWYVRGGEAFAQNWLQENSGKQNQIADFIRLDKAIVFPFENGAMSMHAFDARNCFNINTLADDANNETRRKTFESLLDVLGFDRNQAETLSASIQDWVDENEIPVSGGAESLAYSNLQPAYQTANRLMIDLTELREIQGVDEEVFQLLRPYVCSVPDTQMNRLNLNTLTLEQAPLLAIIFGGIDGLQAAQTVIAERPANGYSSVDQVWDLQAVDELDLKGVGKDKVDIQSDMIGMDMVVNYLEQTQKQKSIFITGGINDVQLVSRRSVY